MKNLIKNSFYTGMWVALLSLNNVTNAINVGGVNSDIRTAWSADAVIQTWLTNLLRFLYLVAVLYAIWGGFNILTAAWDEEKVKKWKTVLINAVLWIFVIFLAWSIIEWIVGIVWWTSA